MVVILDESLKDKVDQWASRKVEGANNATYASYGLLLGHSFHPAAVYGIDLIETSSSSDDDDSDVDEDGADNNQQQGQIDENWFVKHALEVCKMLPGGVNIIGAFVIENGSADAKKDSHVVELLDLLASNLPPYAFPPSSSSEHIDWFTLRYLSKRIVMKQYKSSTTGELDYSSGQPSDVKYQSILKNFNSLKCVFPIDIEIPLAKDGSIIETQLKQSISETSDSIKRSLALVAGKPVLNPNETLDKLSSGNEKEVKFCSTVATQIIRKPAVKDIELAAQLHLSVQIVGIAYALANSPVGPALEALKQDITNSLHSRIELLGKELSWKQQLLKKITKAKSNNAEIFDFYSLKCDSILNYKQTTWVLPKRVFIPFHSVAFCDYKFPYEPDTDVIDRASNILGLKTSSETLSAEVTTEDNGKVDQPALLPQDIKKPEIPKKDTIAKANSSARLANQSNAASTFPLSIVLGGFGIIALLIIVLVLLNNK